MMAQALLFPPLSTSSSRATIPVCHSSAASNTPQPRQTTPQTPLLADQLHPITLNIPRGHRSQTASDETTTLSLHSQRGHGIYPSSLYDLKYLSMVSDRLNSLHLSEDVDDASVLASFFRALDDALPDPLTPDSALFLLERLSWWHKAYCFFQWLKSRSFFPLDNIFYNVTMEALRQGRQLDLIERLAQEMIDIGVDLNNVTYSIVITAAKHRRQYDTAIGWIERMYKNSVTPDAVTSVAAMNVYVKLGRVGEAMSLFKRGRASGWRPDARQFATLGRMFMEASDYEGIQYLLREMENLGVEPDVVVYNGLLEGLWKAGKPRVAWQLFEHMLAAGLAPDENTIAALVKICGKAGWSTDLLKLLERIVLNKWPVDSYLYNTLLVECAALGLESQADPLFAKMKASEKWRPGGRACMTMIKMYIARGEGDKALQVFEEMLKRGIEPTLMMSARLILCLGEAGRVDDVVRVFGVVMEWGIQVDYRFCLILLDVIATCQEAEMDKVLACLDKVGPRFVKLIRLLSSDDAHFGVVSEEFRVILNEADEKVRKRICNSFIDVCVNQNFPPHRAQELFSLGVVHGLYPNLHSETYNEWSLDLRSLAIGAAYAAFDDWVWHLKGKIGTDSTLPKLFSIHTGMVATDKSSLTPALVSRLEELAAPFRQSEESSGYFTATREELVSWMFARVPGQLFPVASHNT